VRSAGWFRAGAILLLVTAGLHAVGAALRPAPEGEVADLVARMAALERPMFGMTPSTLDAFATLDLYFPILGIMAGVQALLVWREREAASRLLRPTAVVCMLGALVAAAVALAHELPPPAALFALVAVCFGVSAALASSVPPSRIDR
jgi:hypothetical protein